MDNNYKDSEVNNCMKSISHDVLFDNKSSFDLYKEMIDIFGQEKTEKEINNMSKIFRNILPITPTDISTSGVGRFDKHGQFIAFLNNTYEVYKNRITFKRSRIYKGLEVEETFFYVFN